MNNSMISMLYQVKAFSRFALKLAAWVYGALAILMCIMISFSTLSYFEASGAIAKAVVVIAAYHIVPRLIDWCIRRLSMSKRSV